MNKRRELIIALGAIALVAPLGSFAQPQGKVWRVGFLSSESDARFGNGNRVAAFRAGLRDLGYEEGRNLVIEFRWPTGITISCPSWPRTSFALKLICW
jgi:putative tryptophan/tyrosine transport system substrate-binding protein